MFLRSHGLENQNSVQNESCVDQINRRYFHYCKRAKRDGDIGYRFTAPTTLCGEGVSVTSLPTFRFGDSIFAARNKEMTAESPQRCWRKTKMRDVLFWWGKRVDARTTEVLSLELSDLQCLLKAGGFYSGCVCRKSTAGKSLNIYTSC